MVEGEVVEVVVWNDSSHVKEPRDTKWCRPRVIVPLYSAYWAVVIDRMEDVVARDRPPRVARAPGRRRLSEEITQISGLIWLQLLSI